MNIRKKQSSLGGDALRLTASKVITLCISLATTMLLSRFRTFEEYGTYSQLLLVINLFTSLLMLGLPNSINYFLARAETPEERQQFLSVYYTLSTALSILIGVILVLAIPLIEAYFHNSLIGSFYYFLALYPWASIIESSIENILVVYKKTGFLMAYRILNSAAILSTVLVVKWFGLTFSAYMTGFVAVNLVFAAVVYLTANRLSGGLKLLIDRKWIRTIFTFSIPIGLANIVATLDTEIDKLLIGYMMNTEQLAIYTNAAKELPVTIVASSITAVLLPQLTRMIKFKRTEEAISLWGSATELAFILISLIVAGVFTYAEDALCLLYSEKYLPGVSVFRVYTLNLLLRCTYFGIILNAFGETRKIFFCSLLSLVLNAVLNPLFYRVFGMIGPAIATFLAILLVLLLQLFMTAQITKVSFLQIFPWPRLGSILLLNILFGVVFRVMKMLLPIDQFIGEVSESLLLGVIWSLLYLLLMKKRLLAAWHKLNQGGEENLV